MTRVAENYTNTDRIITKLTSWFAAIIAVILLILGIRYLVRALLYEETNDAQVESYINPVVSRVNGYITDIRFKENHFVKKGDTLIVIEQTQYQLQQQESQDDVNNANAQLKTLQHTIETTLKASEVIRTEIIAAKAKMIREQQDYERYTHLFDAESATRQQMEKTKAARDIAVSEYQSATANYETALSRISDVRSQRSALLAESDRRSVVVNRNKLDLSYTVIKAPYDGKMGRKTIQNGQAVQVNQSLAFLVNESEGKWVTANFKETQIRNLHIGQKAEIEVDAYPGLIYHGQIESISAATGSSFSVLPPDNSTGNFIKTVQRIPVKILITDKRSLTDRLAPGMNANVNLKKNDSDD